MPFSPRPNSTSAGAKKRSTSPDPPRRAGANPTRLGENLEHVAQGFQPDLDLLAGVGVRGKPMPREQRRQLDAAGAREGERGAEQSRLRRWLANSRHLARWVLRFGALGHRAKIGRAAFCTT